MGYNPNASYTTVTDVTGKVFTLQAGAVYDQFGNSWASIPKSAPGNYEPPLALTETDIQSLVARDATVLSSVVYDSSNQAISWTLNDTNFAATYTSTTITVVASNGFKLVATKDTLGRISSANVTRTP